MFESADLSWENGQPFSNKYKDIYFSQDGAAEVERVFINPTNFDELVKKQRLTTIVELGFGTGLNFCVTAQRFLKQNSSNHLHFISFEKHPLTLKDYQKVFANLSRKTPFCKQMLDQIPPRLSGWHRRVFENGKIHLSLFLGEASEGINDLANRQKVPIDLCFLDGFSPSKNPDLWNDDIFISLSKILYKNSQVTTFTVAGAVRKKLENIGFKLQRIDQRPIKRESLLGIYQTNNGHPTHAIPREVNILGAGIAGSTLARNLAENGVAVNVWDPHGIATGASRISASLLHGRLLGDQSNDADFRAKAFHYSVNYLRQHQSFQQTGVLQLTGPNMDHGKMARIKQSYPDSDEWLHIMNPHKASTIADVTINSPLSLWFPDGGIVNLPNLCKELLDHPLIQFNRGLASLTRSVITILATGVANIEAYSTRALEIYPIGGQLDFVRLNNIPKVPIVSKGYTIPIEKNLCALGATYEYQALQPEIASKKNLETCFLSVSENSENHLRATRCVSSDRIPIIGKLDKNIWISSAHGSLGTSSAPLAASIITSQLLGWIPPISKDVEKIIAPGRFEERQARRGLPKSSDDPSH